MSLHTCLVTCKKLHATPVKLCHYKLMSQTASEECLFVQLLIIQTDNQVMEKNKNIKVLASTVVCYTHSKTILEKLGYFFGNKNVS